MMVMIVPVTTGENRSVNSRNPVLCPDEDHRRNGSESNTLNHRDPGTDFPEP